MLNDEINDDADDHVGLMGPLLGRAKKVLFPDVHSCHTNANVSSRAGWATEHGARGYPNPPDDEEKKKNSRVRSRRAMQANSSLVTNSGGTGSESADKENTVPRSRPRAIKKQTKRGISQKMNSLSVCDWSRLPKLGDSLVVKPKRGSYRKMDSLATNCVDEPTANLKITDAASTLPLTRESSASVHNLKNRRRLQTMGCSLSTCDQHVDTKNSGNQPQQT